MNVALDVEQRAAVRMRFYPSGVSWTSRTSWMGERVSSPGSQWTSREGAPGPTAAGQGAVLLTTSPQASSGRIVIFNRRCFAG